MKSIILRLALVLTVFAVIPDALAADSGHAFFDAAYGKTFGASPTDHTGWSGDGGYLWKLDDRRSVGFDVGYIDFGHVVNDSNPMSFMSDEASASAITLGGHFQYLFGADKASIFQVRVGLMSVKFDGSSSTFFPSVPATTVPESSHQTGTYFGLGIGRNITQSFSLILVYDRYSSSDSQSNSGLGLNWLGLEGEYRF